MQQFDNNLTLVLSQSFDKGWKAYEMKCQNSQPKADRPLAEKFKCQIQFFLPFLFGRELRDHVLVNNWENGWKLSDNKENTIIIVYLPQYLEYIGFALLLFVPLFFIGKDKTREHSLHKSHLL